MFKSVEIEVGKVSPDFRANIPKNKPSPLQGFGIGHTASIEIVNDKKPVEEE